MENLLRRWYLKNHTYPTIPIISMSEPRTDVDQLVTLKIPYLDPIYANAAICVTNMRFWRTVSHLRWFVLRLRSNYIVSPHPVHGFSCPVYMHIKVVKFYQDEGHFGSRRLQKKRYQVDHINSNPLDASRQNLRISTPGENAHNKIKKKFRPNGKVPYSSKYKGVSRETRKLKSGKLSTRFKVDFSFNGVKQRPSFKTEKAAARAYAALCQKYVPEFSQPTPVSDSESEEEEEEEQQPPPPPTTQNNAIDNVTTNSASTI